MAALPISIRPLPSWPWASATRGKGTNRDWERGHACPSAEPGGSFPQQHPAREAPRNDLPGEGRRSKSLCVPFPMGRGQRRQEGRGLFFQGDAAMPDGGVSVQDHFLNRIRRVKLPVTIFLVKGVKLQGVVTWFDAFSLLLRR